MNTTCTKCGKEVSANYLARHYQRYHTLTAKTFPCNLCDKIFYEKLRLNQHTRARHNDNPDLIPNENLCIECGKTFISGERLREHKAMVHVVDQVTLTCKVCKKEFQNARVFKRHSLVPNATGSLAQSALSESIVRRNTQSSAFFIFVIDNCFDAD